MSDEPGDDGKPSFQAFGKIVKFRIGEAKIVRLDGIACEVRHDDGPADVTISIQSADDLRAIMRGELDATQAFLGGRIKVSGDIAAAMMLREMFAGSPELAEQFGL